MAPDQADVDEAIRLAKTIGSMTVYQKTKLQKERITGPATSVEELIEKAEAGVSETQIIVKAHSLDWRVTGGKLRRRGSARG